MMHIRLFSLVLLSPLLSPVACALEIQVNPGAPSFCGQGTGGLTVSVMSGVPPYTYEWSNGVTTPENFGLTDGTYSVTVTDATMEQATASGTVALASSYNGYFSHADGAPSCTQPYVLYYAGTENGMPPDPSTGSSHGAGPYSFEVPGYSVEWSELSDACTWYSYYVVSIDAPAGAFVTVNYQDGSGCPGSFNTMLPPELSFPVMQVVDLSGSCTNGSIGSATISFGANPNMDLNGRLKRSNGTYVQNYCNSVAIQSAGMVHSYSNLAPDTYTLVLSPDEFNQFGPAYICQDSITFTIPDIGAVCGQVSGRLYVDGNGNCAYNVGESNVTSTIVEITPGPYYATTNGSGQYSLQLPFGNYDIAELHPVLDQSCPVSITVNAAAHNNVNLGCAPGADLDALVTMASGPARPGFEHLVTLNVRNLTANPMGTVTMAMSFDPALSFISASTAPSSVVGNVLTWTEPTFTMTNAFQERSVTVRLQVPPDVGLLGTTLNHALSLATQNADVDPANNNALLGVMVTGSYDPNDKLATTSSGGTDHYFIDVDEWIDYTIRFQNTGTDTAFNVVITDTLPASLDPATIQWGASSHACTRQLMGTGTVKFIYANILLPDSNVNESASHGFTNFRIKPKLPVLPGTTIENIANIYFDFNEPVITEPSVLMAEFSTGLVQRAKEALIFPNPATDQLTVSGVEQGEWSIHSMDGRMVSAGSLNGEPRISVAHVSDGSYLLRLITHAGVTTLSFQKIHQR